jgi:signal transduction histidine kinase/CheY-like chemotaxis protein
MLAWIRRQSLGGYLAILVLATALPLAILGGVLGVYLVDHSRAEATATLARAAHSLVLAVDEELQNTMTGLQAVSLSPSIDAMDLPAIRGQLMALAATHPSWMGESLSAVDGTLVVLTARPAGQAMPDRKHQSAAGLAAAATGQPQVSDIDSMPFTVEPVLSVFVPVVRGGAVVAILGVYTKPEAWSALLRRQSLPSDFAMSIVDHGGRVFAAVGIESPIVGRDVADWFPAPGSTAATGKAKTRSPAGVPWVTAFERSTLSGWTVGVGIARSALDLPIRRMLGLAAALAGGLTILSVGIALVIGGHLSLAMKRLGFAAGAVMAGDSIGAPPVMPTREFGRLWDMLAQAGAQFAESRKRYKDLVDNFPGALFRQRMAPDGRRTLLFGSSGIPELLGRSTEEIIAGGEKAIRDFVHPDDFATIAQARLANWAAGRRSELLWRYLHPTRGIRWIKELTRPVGRLGDDYILDGYLLDATDEVEAKAALEARERQLEQSRRLEAVGQLAGGIAHDFNNLLGSILGFAQFIIDDSPAESTQRRFAKRIVTAGQRAKALVSQILAFSRNRAPERTSFDLAGLVTETRELLDATIPSTTTFTNTHARLHRRVDADRDQITQVLLNLCINANDALAGTPGEVAIDVGPPTLSVPLRRLLARPLDGVLAAATDVWTEGDGTVFALFGALDPLRRFVALAVADNGCGMSEDVVRRIFDPFFTTKDIGRGTGLGLAVVHGIVLGHGGALLLRTSAAKGTLIEILLPLSPEGTADAAQPETVTTLAEGQGRVLLVDDDVDFGDMLTTALERQGYDVAVYSDPVDALEILKVTDAFDLLISDQTMPRLRGWDLVRAAKVLKPSLPCILCTANPTALERHARRRAGVTAVVLKPLDLHRFLGSVQDILGSVDSRSGQIV